MSPTLLEKAKRYRSPITASPEAVDIALAWARDELRLCQVKHALECKHAGSNIYVQLARGLREALRTGQLVRRHTRQRS